MTNEQAHLLAHLESIEPVPPAEQEAILELTVPLALDPGESFVREGEPGAVIGYVARGWLRYFLGTSDGREFTRYFCTARNFVAPQDGPEGSAYSIQAMTGVSLLVIKRDQWNELVAERPYWSRVTMAVQEYALRLAERRERGLVLQDTLGRYESLLVDYPGIEQSVKQYYIANYLGVTPEALSRIRKKRPSS